MALIHLYIGMTFVAIITSILFKKIGNKTTANNYELFFFLFSIVYLVMYLLATSVVLISIVAVMLWEL